MTLPLVASSSSLAGVDVLVWLKKNVFEKVRVTGNQVFGLHYHEVKGDENTYRDQWYYGRGNDKFTDRRDVYISGDKVLGVLMFDVHLSNDRFRRPQDDKLVLSYEKSGIKTQLGDISASLFNTNELVGFRRSMRGAQIEAKTGPIKLKGVYTNIRSAARTISIQGNNTSGPYYLQAGFIVEGSVSVRVDGEQQKLGDDYIINVDAGTITFLEKVIPPTSTIVISYETLGRNQDRGTILGGGMTYDFGNGVTAGLSHIIQDPKISTSLSQTTEEFEGYGPPDTPYFLSSIPLEDRPVIVKVDGILQTEGVDYYFDANNPMVFYFTRFMPNTSIIRVTYTPMPDSGTFGSGKRTVSGADLAWKFGKPDNGGAILYSLAQSSLETPLGNETGRAHAIRFDYKTGRTALTGTWKDIPSNFVGIEGVGFNRNEQGGAGKLTYHAGDGVIVSLQGAEVKIGTPTFDGEGLKIISGKTQDFRLKTEWKPSDTRGFFVEATRQKGEYDGKGSESFGISSGYTHQMKRFSFEASALNQSVRSKTVNHDGSPKVTDGQLTGGQVTGSYDFGKGVSFSSRLGLVSVQTEGESSTGHVANANLSYQPNSKFETTLAYSDSFSGAITGIPGFGGGYGYGYNGNGFSGGGFNFGLNSLTSKSKGLSLMTRWTPFNALSVLTQLVKTKSEGGNLSNSESDIATLSLFWNPMKRTSVHLDASQSTTKLLNSPGASKTTMMSVGFDHGFSERWNLTANYSRTDFGGSGLSQFGQNLDSYNLRLTYKPAKNQRAFMELGSGRTAGYRADLQEYFSAGYAYDILPGVALVASYKMRNQFNFNDETRDNGYRSSGFDLELQINFRR